MKEDRGFPRKKSKKDKKPKKLKVDENGNPIKKKKKKSTRDISDSSNDVIKRKSINRKMEDEGSSEPSSSLYEDPFRRSCIKKEGSGGIVQLKPPAMRLEAEPQVLSTSNGNVTRRRCSANVPNLSMLMAGDLNFQKDVEPGFDSNAHLPLTRKTMAETMDQVKEREKARRHSEYKTVETSRVPPQRYSLNDGSNAASLNPTTYGSDTAASRPGAVSVTTAAPPGKGSRPNMAPDESYGGTLRPGAVMVGTAAPSGKGSGPSMTRASENYDEIMGRVGAVSVTGAAPSRKDRRTSGSSYKTLDYEAGDVSVGRAAPTGKGGPSITTGLENYDGAAGRVGAISMTTGAPTGKGSARRVGALSVPTASQSGKRGKNLTPRIGAVTMMTPALQGKESLSAVFSAPNETTGGSIQKDRTSHFPSATAPGTQTGGPSHFPSNAETYESALRNEKTRISHFPSAETYPQNIHDSPAQAAGRRKMENKNISRSTTNGRRRSSARTTQSESFISKSTSEDGPSYTNSAESYDGESTKSGSLSLGANGSWRASRIQRSESSSGSWGQPQRVNEDGEMSEGDPLGFASQPVCIGDYGENIPLDAEPGLAYVCVEDLKMTPWYCSCWFKFAIVALIVGGATTGLTIALTDGGPDAPTRPLPTFAPSLTPIDEARQSQIETILLTVTAQPVLKNETSPQYAAFDWIVRYDMLTPSNNGALTDVQKQGILIRYSLATFYYATDGGNWFSSVGWLDGLTHECDWEFITCVNNNQDIVSISTKGPNRLFGSIPSELQTLQNLRELNLTSNDLSVITPDIGAFSGLINLDLSANKIVGTIPTSLFSLSILSLLNLESNQLTGTISPQISGLVSLGQLFLFENFLTGNLSTELKQLTRLDLIDVSANQLMGNVNDILSGLTGLKVIVMSTNLFTGSLTSEFIMQFSELIQLDLSISNLIGSTIPSELGTLTLLESLSLYGTSIVGSIPSELGSLTKLRALSLDENRITGSVPQQLCNVSALEDLRVDCRIPCPCSSCTFVVQGSCPV